MTLGVRPSKRFFFAKAGRPRLAAWLVTDAGTVVLKMPAFDIAVSGLWKYHYAIPALCSDIPALSCSYFFIGYDFDTGTYVCFGSWDSPSLQRMQPMAELPASYFTPGQLTTRAGGS